MTALWSRRLGLGALALLTSCEPELLSNPTFAIWCGGTLCGWEVEEGRVAPAPTWHEADTGASLVGEAVAISQHSDASSDSVDCIGLTLTADVDPGATLSVEIDFFDDGTVEVDHPLVSDDFQEVTYTVTPPERFSGMRVRIRKRGEARAVLGQIRARALAEDECGGEPVVIDNLQAGFQCEGDAECGSGLCEAVTLVSTFGDPASISTCAECDAPSDCDGGQVCGISWDNDAFFGHRACVDEQDKGLGLACIVGAECASGLCASGQCAACAGDGDCAEGCDRGVAGTDRAQQIAPLVCDPGAGLGEPGAACSAPSDCASGECLGEAVQICDPDGRPCTTDTDCPLWELGAECVAVGVDGVCG